MKLLTKAILKQLPPLYANENVPSGDQVAIVKFFHPMSNYTFYATEYDPVQRLFFGLAVLFETELGYTSLEELEDVRVAGLGIERDLHWTPKPLKEIAPEMF
jgi:hypothetical protein